MSPRKLVIAIDGPAASGKSTTAKLVAARLGYLHIDTGAMYRAITLKVLRSGVQGYYSTRIAELVSSTSIELQPVNGSLKILLDGRDVSEAIRSPEVTTAVSSVSSIRQVRAVLVSEQRRIGRQGGVVLEGRDIGTVVFPDADLKVFMIASIDARALRRQRELRQHGIETDLNILREEIRQRDEKDSTRDESPLKKADDAIELDTSEMSIDEQVEFVVRKAEERMKAIGS
ncbi:MAG: (d)CMP kinase [Bacteroidetes bacterium]|nr:(d)CMP kinase [Bacteroidota bacterium]MCW5896130.1 (d)CMP kinase [Bacteroidota bacterium]